MNPLRQLLDDVTALEEQEQGTASLVQVPLKRANAICGLSVSKWKEALGGVLDERKIEAIVEKGSREGCAAALNSVDFLPYRLQVATDVKDNCKDLRILEWSRKG